MDLMCSRRRRGRLGLVLAVALLAPATLLSQGAQKRALDHEDYDSWPSIRGTAYSQDGQWVAYTIAPQSPSPAFEGVLEVRRVGSDTVYRHERGTGAAFSANGRFLVFRVPPSEVDKKREEIEDLLREAAGEEPRARRRGGRGQRGGRRGGGQGGRGRRGGGRGRGGASGGDGSDEDALGIMDLSTGNVELIENVRGFRIPEDSDTLVYHMGEPADEDEEEAEEEEPEEQAGEEEEDPAADKRRDGTRLVVRNLTNRNERRYEGVVGYGLTSKGSYLYYHSSSKEPKPGVEWGLHVVNLSNMAKQTLVEGAATYSGFTSDEEEQLLAFTSDLDDFESEDALFDVYLWNVGTAGARKVIGSDDVPVGKVITQNGLSFSEDASVLSFGIRNAPEEDAPPIHPDDVVVLDMWSWLDPLLQPNQQQQAGQARNPTWSCVLHVDSGRVTVLGDEAVPSVRLITPDGSRALAQDNTPYLQLVSWDTGYNDVYLVNTVDGSRRLVLEKQRGGVQVSPDGRYLAYFSGDYNWRSIDTQSLEVRNLTEDLDVHFERELDDHPAQKPAHGIAGWTEGDEHVLINDEFDIWKVSPETGEATNVTDGFGRANKITLRYQRMDPDLDHVPEEFWLSARDTETMAMGYYTDSLVAARTPRKLVMMDKAIGGLTKAEDADRLFFTQSTWAEFPNIFTSATDFSGLQQVSRTNPENDVRWGSSELVEWMSSDGIPLKGFLVKPEGFDPSKKYPMLVYFYERNAQNVHRYTSPSPGTSPNAAYYVSNGYLWFVPDIVYKDGYPGPSCYNCLVPGVQSLIAKGFVDENGIGIAGHSWGGYQTAYLVTRTDMFAAAESGAPVVNMFSAYGGIRWQSGRNRAMQYERGQSRIGGSIWEYPMRYWENSPLFFADKVNTPVLMLHNDEDGAVPWYQGIEFLTALRRLGKEAYMANYVGEPHGLRRRANQKDWTRRMAEFFDHHLRGAPAPTWMTDGIPFIDRDSEKLQYMPPYILEASSRGQGSGSGNGGRRNR